MVFEFVFHWCTVVNMKH